MLLHKIQNLITLICYEWNATLTSTVQSFDNYMSKKCIRYSGDHLSGGGKEWHKLPESGWKPWRIVNPICHQEGQSKRLFKIFAFSCRIFLLFPIFPLFFPISPSFLDFFQIFCKFFAVRVATPLLKTRLKEVRICQNLVRPGICTISVSLTTTKMWAHTMIWCIGVSVEQYLFWASMRWHVSHTAITCKQDYIRKSTTLKKGQIIDVLGSESDIMPFFRNIL